MSTDDPFALFQLPRRFVLDETALAETWRRAQAQVHPDRFVSASAAERRVSEQWAARINDAYRVLKSPLERAACLCALAGHPVEGNARSATNTDFLQRQLAWRETLADAAQAADPVAMATLGTEVEAERAAAWARLADLLDGRGDYLAAGAQVRDLMFIERFVTELAQAQDRAQA